MKLPIEARWLYEDVDLLGMVDTTSIPIFVQYIKEIIEQEGIEKFRSLDVWSKELCELLEVQDPRTGGWKMLHWYLRKSQRYRSLLWVRVIDSIFKKFV